jgi:hypothetical protein
VSPASVLRLGVVNTHAPSESGGCRAFPDKLKAECQLDRFGVEAPSVLREVQAAPFQTLVESFNGVSHADITERGTFQPS